MNILRTMLIGFAFIVLSSCGSAPTEVCQASSKSYSGCCSSHGGVKSCGSGSYDYLGTSIECIDGSASPTCTS